MTPPERHQRRIFTPKEIGKGLEGLGGIKPIFYEEAFAKYVFTLLGRTFTRRPVAAVALGASSLVIAATCLALSPQARTPETRQIEFKWDEIPYPLTWEIEHRFYTTMEQKIQEVYGVRRRMPVEAIYRASGFTGSREDQPGVHIVFPNNRPDIDTVGYRAVIQTKPGLYQEIPGLGGKFMDIDNSTPNKLAIVLDNGERLELGYEFRDKMGRPCRIAAILPDQSSSFGSGDRVAIEVYIGNK